MRGIGDTTDDVRVPDRHCFEIRPRHVQFPRSGRSIHGVQHDADRDPALKSAFPQLPRLLKFGGALYWYQVMMQYQR